MWFPQARAVPFLVLWVIRGFCIMQSGVTSILSGVEAQISYLEEWLIVFGENYLPAVLIAAAAVFVVFIGWRAFKAAVNKV